MKRALSVVAVTCAAALLALALLARRDSRLPDIEIRYEPRQTQSSRIFPGFAQGEGFVCERNGLHAIEVAAAPIPNAEAGSIEFVLRAATHDAPVLRRARIAAEDLPHSDGWLRFEFEPIADSAHGAYFFELSSAGPPSSHAPWIRYRGYSQLVRAWGDRIVADSARDGEFLCLNPDLRALAFAVDGLDAAAGPATLVLTDAGGVEVRRSELRPSAPQAAGWVCFSFDAIPNSRWRKFHYHLETPPVARLVGTQDGLSLITFHGGGFADERLLGMTCGKELLTDRDIAFRALSGDGANTLVSRLAQRGGTKLGLAACAWLASIAVAFVALRRREAS